MAGAAHDPGTMGLQQLLDHHCFPSSPVRVGADSNEMKQTLSAGRLCHVELRFTVYEYCFSRDCEAGQIKFEYAGSGNLSLPCNKQIRSGDKEINEDKRQAGTVGNAKAVQNTDREAGNRYADPLKQRESSVKPVGSSGCRGARVFQNQNQNQNQEQNSHRARQCV